MSEETVRLRQCRRCGCELNDTDWMFSPCPNDPSGDGEHREMGPLTLEYAALLGDLIRGVERGYRLRYYRDGADTDVPWTATLRAFTRGAGAAGLPVSDDVRHAAVWTSGTVERWFQVADLVDALSNLDGHLGDTSPIAIIEPD